MKIGFIGAGQMARALAAGFAKAESHRFFYYDPNVDAVAMFNQIAPAQMTAVDSNHQLAAESELVVIAVKPQIMEPALAGLDSKSWRQDSIVVSVAAGIRIERLKQLTGHTRIIRVMPNTPCLIGEGAMGVAVGSGISTDEERAIIRLLESVGLVVKVTEHELHAVTGLSGSGPAYVFTFIEALAAAGQQAGLSKEIAGELALQTVLGSAQLLKQTAEPPIVLRERVTSPGGTTLKGLEALSNAKFSEAITAAVNAAIARSKELGS